MQATEKAHGMSLGRGRAANDRFQYCPRPHDRALREYRRVVTSTPGRHLVHVAAAAAVLLVVSSCGSDDDSAENTDPTVADPATTTTTVTASVDTTEPAGETTTPPTDDDLTSFCVAAEEFYVVAGAAIEYVTTGAGVGALVPQMLELAEQAAAAAPTDQLAAGPDNAVSALTVLDTELAAVDYDADRLDEAADPVNVQDAFGIVNDEYLNVETFLRTSCDSDLGALDDRSQQLAAETEPDA